MTQIMLPLTNSPLNALFLAINHYMSTGDHAGEGVSMEAPDDRVLLVLAVNRTLTTDQQDFQKLRARLEELREEFPFTLKNEDDHAVFIIWSLTVRTCDILPLARRLLEAPGPLGWGSMEPLLRPHRPQIDTLLAAC